MQIDLIRRLRRHKEILDNPSHGCMICDAADEIVKLRAAGDALAAKVLDVHQPFEGDKNIDLWWLVQNWENAVRER